VLQNVNELFTSPYYGAAKVITFPFIPKLFRNFYDNLFQGLNLFPLLHPTFLTLLSTAPKSLMNFAIKAGAKVIMVSLIPNILNVFSQKKLIFLQLTDFQHQHNLAGFNLTVINRFRFQSFITSWLSNLQFKNNYKIELFKPIIK